VTAALWIMGRHSCLTVPGAAGAEVIEILATLAAHRGATVIVATHHTQRAGRARRRLAMRDGRLLAADALSSAGRPPAAPPGAS
jgi:energy-coupling factor transporter ATP-binding protein EcfA2